VRLCGNARGHASGDGRFATSQATQLFEQLRAADVLDQVPLRTSLDGFDQLLRGIVHGEHDRRHVWKG
jgi:hypothetical protein